MEQTFLYSYNWLLYLNNQTIWVQRYEWEIHIIPIVIQGILGFPPAMP